MLAISRGVGATAKLRGRIGWSIFDCVPAGPALRFGDGNATKQDNRCQKSCEGFHCCFSPCYAFGEAGKPSEVRGCCSR
jgi:hypothetical protein